MRKKSRFSILVTVPKKLLLWVVLALTALSLLSCDASNFGPRLSGCEKCEELSEEFFRQITRGNTKAAFASLGQHRGRDQLKVEEAIRQTNIILRTGGAIQGYELLSSKSFGSRVLVYNYLTYQLSDVSRWSLYFYDSQRYGWILVNFNGTNNHSDF